MQIKTDVFLKQSIKQEYFLIKCPKVSFLIKVHFIVTLCLDNVYELLPKNQEWQFSFCKVPEDFPEKNVPICAPTCFNETE